MKPMVKRMALLLMMASLLASCSTEKRALYEMRHFTTQLEQRSDRYDKEDWHEAWAEYKKIDAKMEDIRELKPEQQKEYGELQARCIKQFAKSKIRNVVDSIKAYLNQGAGFLRGLLNLIDD